MNVYLGQHTVSDMLGPCEDGFHVPLKTEWKAILDAGISLGAWTSSGGSNFGRYLKLPMAGYRNGNSVDNIGSYGQYWGADIFGGSVDTITHLYFNSSSITNGYSTPKFGYPIRPIKDYPVTPTSGWTTIVGTLGSSGIFWNQTDGLISISSNGSTWYTISDKNVGATTVWNYGDALTEANCGSTFQRGNNYAFPSTKSTASVTTSSTQVDVTGYGPGNYYSSSTWITASTWQSSSNKNLRGGQTKGTWLKDTMLKNAYIGEYHKYVFDFQNEGQLGWTLDSETSEAANIGYESGQGLYMYSSSTNTGKAGFFKMPSNVHGGTLKSIKIHYYIPNTASGVGIRGGDTSSGFHRGRNSNTIGLGNSNSVNIGNYTGEIIAEWNITSTGCSGTISGKAFSFTSSEANNFITAYNNNALKIYGVARYHNNRIYIRKVEIESV